MKERADDGERERGIAGLMARRGRNAGWWVREAGTRYTSKAFPARHATAAANG